MTKVKVYDAETELMFRLERLINLLSGWVEKTKDVFDEVELSNISIDFKKSLDPLTEEAFKYYKTAQTNIELGTIFNTLIDLSSHIESRSSFFELENITGYIEDDISSKLYELRKEYDDEWASYLKKIGEQPIWRGVFS